MWQISKEFSFEAAHFLPNVPQGHQCSRVHGHSYKVVVELSGESLAEEQGWIEDFAVISDVVKPIVKQLDHRLLNDVDEGLKNPTSEILAAWIGRTIAPRLPKLSSVAVKETAASTARWNVVGGVTE
jgi:6-pyruvoyltetrahydropterin/6-carboxytetrahydropterin synthase